MPQPPENRLAPELIEEDAAAALEAITLHQALSEEHQDPLRVLMVCTHLMAIHLACCRADMGTDVQVFAGTMQKLRFLYDQYMGKTKEQDWKEMN